jgi:hypothetical protein
VRVAGAEVPEVKLTDEGLSDAIGPEGETVDVRFTLPEKPFRPVIVTVAVPDEPWATVKEDGLDVTPKSASAGDCTSNIPTM